MDRAFNYFNTVWNHQGFQKYFKNTGWMMAARTISLITSFFTIALVARYLGPENLGKLEYSRSFVSIISVFASLGIDQILYRDLVAKPEKQDQILGTALFTKIVFGSIAFLLSIGISLLINEEILLTGLIAIIALTFLISPLGTIGILFDAKVQAKYKSQVTIFLAFFIPILKLLIILLGGGILFFASVVIAEALISAAWTIYIYKTKFEGSISFLNFNWPIFKNLIKDSWPLFLAGLSAYIYAKLDQIMLLHYLGPAEVGIYSAVVKLTEIWVFFPGIVLGSFFPAIVNARKNDFASFAKRFKKLSGLVLGTSLAIVLPIFLLAPFLVNLIFGSEYMAAVPVLHIYIWIGVLVVMIELKNQILITENFGKIFLYTSLIGALGNILLNVMLIPAFGISGAATATLTSYGLAIVSVLLFKKSRDSIMKTFKYKL